MTEAEWLACTETTPMLAFLRNIAGYRELRLFVCACCRRIWDLLIYPESRNAVEVAERFANNNATPQERADAYTAAARTAAGWTNCCGEIDATIGFAVSAAAFSAANEDTIDAETAAAGDRVTDLLIMAEAQNPELWPDPFVVAARNAAIAAATAVLAWNQAEDERADWEGESRADWEIAAIGAGETRGRALGLTPSDFDDHLATWDRLHAIEQVAQCHFLRDIFGNPFAPPRFDPSWRTSDVVALAEGIYAERAFDRLPILADALQDAGCDNDELLSHLRAEQAHVRGCWALDLCLGRG